MKKHELITVPFFLVSLMCSLLTSETYHYTVYFWKIPCVDITMTIEDTPDPQQKELIFITKTKQVFSYFFSVDNTYSTVFDGETFQMIQYEKKIIQPNLEQKIKIEWNPNNQTYNQKKIEYKRPPGTHNVFSLLMRGRSNDWESLDTKWWDVDHEGTPFRSRYLWIDSVEVDVNGKSYMTDHYRIDLIPTDEEPTKLVDVTDVFSWGIALEGCVRETWVERGNEHRILRTRVNVRGFTLTAELKND